MTRNKIVILALAVVVFLGLLVTVLGMRLLEIHPPWGNKPSIELVKEQYESELMAVKGVVGVGISECQGKPCIAVYLANESPNLRKQIPARLDGFNIDIKVMGNIEAFSQP